METIVLALANSLWLWAVALVSISAILHLVCWRWNRARIAHRNSVYLGQSYSQSHGGRSYGSEAVSTALLTFKLESGWCVSAIMMLNSEVARMFLGRPSLFLPEFAILAITGVWMAWNHQKTGSPVNF